MSDKRKASPALIILLSSFLCGSVGGGGGGRGGGSPAAPFSVRRSLSLRSGRRSLRRVRRIASRFRPDPGLLLV
jgi:hypothetical protein